MLDRIQELLQVRELSASQFADAIGVSRPVVSHILSGRNKPSLEVVQKVIAAFPDLSISWLLSGAGPMLERPATPTKASTAPVSAIPASQIAAPPTAPATTVAAQPFPASEPAISVASVPTATPAAAPYPSTPPPEPSAPLKPASQPRVAAPPVPATAVAAPADTDLAYALAEPGKSIRRIVLFYQDGTFADFRPESGA